MPACPGRVVLLHEGARFWSMSKSAARNPPGIHGFRHWQEHDRPVRESREAVPATETSVGRPQVRRISITTEPEDVSTAALLDEDLGLPDSSRADQLAHLLRTPITPLRSAIWLMQRYEEGHPLDPRVREKRARLLSMMDRNIDRLLEVVAAIEEDAKQQRHGGTHRDDDVHTPGVASVQIGEAQTATA